MWDNKRRRWRQDKYEGYGVFGGKDYFVLLAEMNKEYGLDVSDDKKRSDGIRMEGGEGILHPNLTNCNKWTWTNKCPRSCPEQGASDWNQYADYYSDDECVDYSKGINFTDTDRKDNWPNGETNPNITQEELFVLQAHAMKEYTSAMEKIKDAQKEAAKQKKLLDEQTNRYNNSLTLLEKFKKEMMDKKLNLENIMIGIKL